MPLLEADPSPLRVESLKKRFGRHDVLSGVDLHVPLGSIYALLGQNGAGKTTTLKCTLGLLRATSGRVRILGRAPEELYRTEGEVGVVFDTPCLHPELTVRQMLEHGRRIAGKRSRAASEVEELLGIGRYRRVKIRKLSWGNMRRTSLAYALVGRPSLLILDEPFSGLDAGGIDDVLALIRKLRREENATFLLASHQLSCLEGISTHVGILSAGVMALEGSVEQVFAPRGFRLWVRTSAPERACELIRLQPGVRSVEVAGDGRVRIEAAHANPAHLNRLLVDAGFEVSELETKPPTLEALFREVTGR